MGGDGGGGIGEGALTGGQFGMMTGNIVGVAAGVVVGAVVGAATSGQLGDFGDPGATPTVGGSAPEGADFGTGGMHGPPGTAPDFGAPDSGAPGGPSPTTYTPYSALDPLGQDRPVDYWVGGKPVWLKGEFREPVEPEVEPEPTPYVDPQADLDEIDAMNRLATERGLKFAPARGEESTTRSLDVLSERDQLVGARGPEMFKRTPRSALEKRQGVPVSYGMAL